MSLPAVYPACSIACMMTVIASSFERKFGAKPPSSPTAVFKPCFFSTDFRLWNTSVPARKASPKLVKLTGSIINSWISTVLSAWAPPFRMFIIGTGIDSDVCPRRLAMYWWSGSFCDCAAARAAAKDTAKVALAPNFSLFSVPSSANNLLSMSCCFDTSISTSDERISLLTLATAFLTPLPR